MNTLSLSLFVDISRPATFSFKYATTKADSISKSLVQKLGLAYRKADLIADRIPQNPYAAKSSLVSDALNMGFDSNQAECLLGAKTWELRLQYAWSMISPLERRRVRNLDYTEFENYWPTQDFSFKHAALVAKAV